MNSPVAVSSLRQGNHTEPKTIFNYLEDPRVKTGIAAVAGKFLTADRMLRLCINAVKKAPKLAECDPQTVLGAMMTSAALGLEPNTVQQQAFLIPYKRRARIRDDWVDVYDCQFQIGARGFVTLAYRSPHIKSIAAEAIHQGDLFEHMQGSSTFLRYAKSLNDRGDLIGAFSHVHLADGGETACVLPLAEIHKIRAKSETFQSLLRDVANAGNQKDKEKAQRKLEETPWVMWEDDMASKSAIKKHAKQLPIASGDALIAAAEIDNRGELGGIDMRAMADVEVVRSVVSEGLDAPAITHDPGETLDAGSSGEAFGATARQNDAATQTTKTTPPAAQRTSNAPGKTDKPAFDLNAFAAKLEACREVETLDILADEVTGMSSDGVITQDDAQMLFGIYRRCRDDLTKPAAERQPPAAAAATTTATRPARQRPSAE